MLCQPLTFTGSWEGRESEDPPYPRPFRRPQIPQANEGEQEEVDKVVQGKFEREEGVVLCVLSTVCVQQWRI